MSYLISILHSRKVSDFTSAAIQDQDILRDYPAAYRDTVDLFLDLTPINSFSVISEKFNSQDVPIPWNHEKYEIWVSNDAWDNPPADYYSYEYQVLKNPNDGWIKIKEYDLGTGLNCNNSFSESVYTSPIFYKYCRITIQKIPETKIRITAELR